MKRDGQPLPGKPESGASWRPPSPRYKWYLVAMLWWISFFNYADRQAIFSVFPLLEQEMGLSPVELGLLGSSFAWTYGLAAPLAGYVVDRVRRKTAILAGLHIWSLICALTALSRNFRHLLLFRAAEGLGETFYYPASMSLISDYHGKATRSRAMGLHQTSVYVGTIGGGFFAGWIGQRYGWRWSFIVFGALGILLGVVLHRFLHEAPRGAADRAEAGAGATPLRASLPLSEFFRVLARTPSALLLMGAFVCANFVAVVLLSWMPKFLYDRFQMSLAMAGLTATLFVQLASMVGSPLGGWMADALRRRTPRGRPLVQALGVLGGAPFVALCGLTPSVAVLVAALTAWGLFKGLYDANIFASVYDVMPPEARGTAAGFMNCVGWLGGGGTAPVIIGLIAQRESLGLAIALTSSVYLLAAVLLLAAAVLFMKRDVERIEREMLQAASSSRG
ncbi:MAG: MFS transporter [Bryobacterales bacterium]|nr:MFS transporter [Bryobacteraceae bacterium]MDW8354650.1 MFS transporter [Bryobacterales bacterium]